MDRQQLESLDARDPLAPVRNRFLLRDGLIYLDGNSLGPLSQSARDAIERLTDEWQDRLISGWFEGGWVEAPSRVGARIARLVGALPDEVVVTDSTTVNLHKLAAAALQRRPQRNVILTAPDDFPTDRYVAAELARLHGARLVQVAPDQMAGALDESVALLMLTHVDYRSGRVHDMAGLTRAAHAAGALALWDLCHSVGALPVDLDGCDVDLAAGCTYKFLNGGPGAPAFVYVANRLAAELRSPIPGWFGHADSFQFAEGYEPAASARRFLAGTPGMLGMAALEGALRVWDDIDMADVRSKSVLLGRLLIELVDERCAGAGVEIVSPRDGAQRGSQVSIRHPQAALVTQRLAERDVVTDFRPPDIVRFGLTPLYLRFVDLWGAVEQLRSVLDELSQLPERSPAS
ncbi:MAG: kynureninase [Candidatus Dormiibacterota bacterium]